MWTQTSRETETAMGRFYSLVIVLLLLLPWLLVGLELVGYFAGRWRRTGRTS